jgi:hypothetical protein
VKEADTRPGTIRTIRSHTAVNPRESDGILVEENELSSATAQQMFRIRCECGRSWFELELKQMVKCPGCSRLSRVEMA